MTFERERLMIKLGAKNILVNWRHSLSTLLAVGVGFSAVSLFDGFLLHLKDFTSESYINRGALGDVIVKSKVTRAQVEGDPWLTTISESDQKKIDEILAKDNRIAVRAKFLYMSGVVNGSKNSPIFAGTGYEITEADQIRGKWYWNVLAGRPLREQDNEGTQIAIGLAKQLGCQFKTENTMLPSGYYIPEERPFECGSGSIQLSVTTQNSQINAASFKVVGLLDLLLREVNDMYVAMPLKTAQRLFDTTAISRVSVLLKNPGDAAGFVKDLQSEFDSQDLNIEAVPWIEAPDAAAAKGGMEILRIFRALFLSTVAIVAAMSVANSMMKSVNERIREIGTLRSLGFRRDDIQIMFISEGFFLGFISCVAGLVFTVVVAETMTALGLTFSAGILSGSMPLAVKLNMNTWIMTLFLLAGICALTSWIIVRRAARMVVADTLRHVA